MLTIPQTGERRRLLENAQLRPATAQHTNLTLTPHDAEVLASRAISSAIAGARGYRSISGVEAKDYGFPAIAGLLIPSYGTQGEIERFQLRPHAPPIDPATGKPRKYLWPAGSRQSIDVPPASLATLRDVDIPILITESPLKADAILTALARLDLKRTFCVIAVAGVYGWRSDGMPLSDHGDIPWRRKTGDRITFHRRVFLVFDSDTATNPNVARARWEYAQFLRRRGASVQYIDVPPDRGGGKQGIDDALAAGHDLHAMIEGASPAPDIMPAIGPDTAADDGISEAGRLRTENATLRAHVSILTSVITTPHVAAKTKALILRIAALSRAKAARGEVDDAGAVYLSAAEISGDWRPATTKGHETPAMNADGSVPLMKRGAVITAARAARDLGLIDFAQARVRKTHTNGNAYWDTDLIVTPPVSIGAALAPMASYTSVGIGPRPYRRPKPCPECGEIHARNRETVCLGCGAVQKVEMLLVPAANDAETETVTSTKIGEVTDGDIVTPSPAPINYLSTKTVEVTPSTDALDLAAGEMAF